ncbi:MAG: TlpA disulfide reductase family protein [Ornithinimicrobium sp.]
MAPGLILALLLTACSSDDNSISEQARAGDDKNYIAGDGSVTVLSPGDRQTEIELSGQTLEGQRWSSEQALGEVLVVNVWGSWCGPCQAEAADLNEVYAEFTAADEPVRFIGVNHRDSVPTALAFQRAKDVQYPSLEDDGGQTLTQLKGLANARPSTLVLDRSGLVAARVLGQVDASTLTTVLRDVLAEPEEPSEG